MNYGRRLVLAYGCCGKSIRENKLPPKPATAAEPDGDEIPF